MDLIILALIGWSVFLLIIGYTLPYANNIRVARIIGWCIVISTTILSIAITAQESPTYRMITIASLQLLSLKIIVLVETYRGKPNLTIIQWLAFALGWFGMRPNLFETFPSKSLNNVIPFIIKGITRMLIGLLLLKASVYLQIHYSVTNFLYELCMLVGLSFILHFGILNLSTASFRSRCKRIVPFSL
jgi:hypothetical protein